MNEQIINELKILKDKIDQISRQLRTYPSGELSFRHNSKYIKWFLKNEGKITYINSKNRHLAETLAQKKYLTFLLCELKTAYDSLEKYINKINNTNSFLELHPCYTPLLKTYLAKQDSFVKDWLAESFIRNPYYPEKLTRKTNNGIFVRSKSEVIIANLLIANNIPFKYECGLNVDCGTIYPDFTILCQSNHKVIYWEHLGMMDDKAYANHAFEKLALYNRNGITPTINLITTYETLDNPIDSSYVQLLIDRYCR